MSTIDQSLLIPIKMPSGDAPKYKGRPRRDGLPPGSPEAKAADAAKGKGTGSPRGRRTTKISDADLKAKLVELYAMAGMAVMAKPKYASTAIAIVQNAESCADAWIAVAKENKAVRMVLERMITVSTFGTLIFAHMPILISIAADSGVVGGDLADSLKSAVSVKGNGDAKAA